MKIQVISTDGIQRVYEVADLKKELVAGRVTPACLVQIEGSSVWKPLKELPEVCVLIFPPPPSLSTPGTQTHSAPVGVTENKPEPVPGGRKKRPILAIVVAVSTFTVAYWIVGLFQPERSLYSRFEALGKHKSDSLSDLSAQAKQISLDASDHELKFVGEYASRMFSQFHEAGYQNLAEAGKGLTWDAAFTTLAYGAAHPIDSTVNSSWLLWNMEDAKRAERMLGNRYGGINFTAIVISALAAYAGLRTFSSKRERT